MKILKFGGTSVGSPERIRAVTAIISKSRKGGDVAVVVSAFSKVTDQLVEASELASCADTGYTEALSTLKERHLSALRALADPKRLKKAEQYIEGLFAELKDVLHGVFLVKQRSAQTLDTIISFGERLSAFIVSEALLARGVQARYFDARSVVRTDDAFGSAHVDIKTTYQSIKKNVKKNLGVHVITGFIGSTSKRETTTLGRGGSDYTAALFGAALGASSIEIWTDVDGFMTADPRKVPNARVIKRLRYAEAAELSHFGAKVLHLPTIRPARDKSIPILIKNTLHPTAPGTSINTKSRNDTIPITGVTSITNIGLLQIQGDGMQGIPGTAGRFFHALAGAKVNTILITQASSEYSICVAVEEKRLSDAKRAVEKEFELEIMSGQIDSVDIRHTCSIVAVVGENMQHTPGMAKKIFGPLGDAGVNIIAIALGSSELNVSMVVKRDDEITALRAVHNAFFSKKNRG